VRLRSAPSLRSPRLAESHRVSRRRDSSRDTTMPAYGTVPTRLRCAALARDRKFSQAIRALNRLLDSEVTSGSTSGARVETSGRPAHSSAQSLHSGEHFDGLRISQVAPSFATGSLAVFHPGRQIPQVSESFLRRESRPRKHGRRRVSEQLAGASARDRIQSVHSTEYRRPQPCRKAAGDNRAHQRGEMRSAMRRGADDRRRLGQMIARLNTGSQRRRC
jgi:hypothetical protein